MIFFLNWALPTLLFYFVETIYKVLEKSGIDHEMNGAESRKTRSSCMGKAGMFWKKRSPECDGLASRACSKTVPPLLQHSHRWNGGAAKINSIHIEKFVAREMGSCDVLRKEFQGHTCESSLSVRPDLLG